MYTKEEREGILWEFHQSGLSVPEACRRLPLFPTRANLYRWLRMEEAGELAATEMPDRAARMLGGRPRWRARSRPTGATGAPTCRTTRRSARGWRRSSSRRRWRCWTS